MSIFHGSPQGLSWSGLVEWIKLLLLEEKRIAPEDLDILQVMDEPKEIVKAIKKVIIV